MARTKRARRGHAQGRNPRTATPEQTPAGLNVNDSTSIPNLPPEILHYIVSDATLTQQDAKALRQTCRGLSGIAASRVFRRAGLSRLRVDRDSFLRIAGSPHLAPLVRELAWHDLNLEMYWYADGPEQEWVQRIESVTSNPQVFWLPRIHDAAIPSDSRRHHRREIDDFDSALTAALKNLPRLDTIIIRPMPNDRVLGVTDAGHEVRAAFFHGHLYNGTGNATELFLLPMLRRPDARITKLFLADESAPLMPHLDFLRLHDTSAFERLATIDFCLALKDSYVAASDPSLQNRIELLASCLQAARALESLTLCFENIPTDEGYMENAFETIFGAASWPCLRKLELVDCQVTKPMSTLLLFLGAHRSLRHLKLINCGLKLTHVPDFYDRRDRFGLELKSVMIASDTGWSGISISEEDMLAVLNEGAAPPPPPLDDGDDPTDYSLVDWLKGNLDPSWNGWFQIDGMTWLDSRSMEDESGENEHVSQVLEDGLPLCTHHFIFDHEVMHKHSPAFFHSLLAPDEYSKQDFEEMEAPEHTPGALPGEPPAPEDGSPQDSSDSDSDSEDDYSSDSDSDFDSEETLEKEVDEDYLEDVPNWSWGRYCGTLYYWRNPDGPLATENWRFSRTRFEESAIGDDPLTFWERWRGPAGGDTAEPLPCSAAFSKAQTETYRGDCLCRMLGQLDQARAYRPEDDVMVGDEQATPRERAAGMAVRDMRSGFDEGTCTQCWNLDKRLGGSTKALVALLKEAGLSARSLL